MEGDAEATVAHYALHRLKKFPGELLELSKKEYAFVVASILHQASKEKKEQDQIERKAGR